MFDFITIRVRTDNLMYLFYDENYAFSVDSYEPETILKALSCTFNKRVYTKEEILALEDSIEKRDLLYAFTTHWHDDHSGGDSKLAELSPTTIFVKYKTLNNIKSISDADGDESVFKKMVINGCTVDILHTPCHTKDSLCFYVDKKYLITGDFLFNLGCGRFFEGCAVDFLKSLNKILYTVTGETLLLPGHDYYDINLRFARKYLPMAGERNSFFSTMNEEKKYNPFVNYWRIDLEGTDCDKITFLRRKKDEFKYWD
ncbi:hydroxyacylglutathione hydrolase [Enteropsectra breve]|nr:hydroxyacylglutathione hydrolase [Enteropsectra breve]